MKRIGWDDQMRDIKTKNKSTYELVTDEEDGMGSSDERS